MEPELANSLIPIVVDDDDDDIRDKKCLIFGRKINVSSTNKYSNELHTAVSLAFSVPSSMQSKK